MLERRVILAFCAVAVAACAPDSADDLTAPPLDQAPLLATQGNRVVALATGGYHFTIPADVFGAPVGNQFSFNAKQHADGGVSGHYNYRQEFQGEVFAFSGRVTCLEIYDGNRAKIGAVIDASNDPTIPVGLFLWWQAIDNGEGENAPPDQSTLIGVGTEEQNEAFCASDALPRFGPWNVEGGNLQVKVNL